MQERGQKQAERPRHLAVIMDGNGRWATRLGRPRLAGHRAGVKAARAIVEDCANAGIEVLTLFAFSSENWQRPSDEVNGLMRLFVEVLQREVKALHENEIRLRFIGDRAALPTILQKRMARAEALTAGNQRMTLIVAIAYGGRWDIQQAVQRVAAKVAAGDLAAEAIDAGVLERHMALAGVPDPDLLIRTGNEQRISNFLLWNLAYTEIYFSATLWPDFAASDLQAALDFYAQRGRRFGRVAQPLGMLAD